jgi:hypothetical protein
MLRSRFMVGVKLDQPVFPNTLGDFRDPNNTRRCIREVRGDGLLAWVTEAAEDLERFLSAERGAPNETSSKRHPLRLTASLDGC